MFALGVSEEFGLRWRPCSACEAAGLCVCHMQIIYVFGSFARVVVVGGCRGRTKLEAGRVCAVEVRWFGSERLSSECCGCAGTAKALWRGNS